MTSWSLPVWAHQKWDALRCAKLEDGLWISEACCEQVLSQKLLLFVYNELLFASVSYYFVIIIYDSYLLIMLICYYLFMLLVVHV